MTHSPQVGFSQRIQLAWLDYTVRLVLAGSTKGEVAAELDRYLHDKLSAGNDPKRGTRHKAITILNKVWTDVPGPRLRLRNQGISLLRSASERERVFIHWCMCMAAYPFFGTVAHATGRLLRLQATVGAAQVQRRVREQLGERETVARATRRILRTFIDWAILEETGEKGLYRAAAKRPVRSGPLGVWALEACLVAKGGGPLSADTLLRGPHLFPFETPLPSARELEAAGSLDLAYHGLDQEVLIALADLEED